MPSEKKSTEDMVFLSDVNNPEAFTTVISADRIADLRIDLLRSEAGFAGVRIILDELVDIRGCAGAQPCQCEMIAKRAVADRAGFENIVRNMCPVRRVATSQRYIAAQTLIEKVGGMPFAAAPMLILKTLEGLAMNIRVGAGESNIARVVSAAIDVLEKNPDLLILTDEGNVRVAGNSGLVAKTNAGAAPGHILH